MSQHKHSEPAAVPIQVQPALTTKPKASRPYVRLFAGVWQKRRQQISMGIWLLLLGLPWCSWDGRPAVQLDFSEPQWFVLGWVGTPNDFLWLAQGLVLAALLLFAVTTYYGRVWCGFVCPQTLWTFAFIKLEQFFEGQRHQRMKRDQQPMSWRKFKVKALKHLAWLIVAGLTGWALVSWVVPPTKAWSAWQDGALSSSYVLACLALTVCTYINAGWMRTLICQHVCPYARFQAVMFDDLTQVVTYNHNRGENRGARLKKQNPAESGLGDCIDCNLCVQVCPAGIDIREGLQYECIQCAACVDACDHVMSKMRYLQGLIGFQSEQANQAQSGLRCKRQAYLTVIALFLAVMVWQGLTQASFEVQVRRDRQYLYRLKQDKVENSLLIEINNHSAGSQQYMLRTDAAQSIQWLGKTSLTVPAHRSKRVLVRLRFDAQYPQQEVQLVVHSSAGVEQVHALALYKPSK